MKKIFFTATLFLLSLQVFSQGSTDYGAGLKFNLNEDGTKFMRVIAWNQIWMRSAQMNPGTMIGGEATSTATDIGNRRLRFLAYAQVSKRYMILTHFGINNQTFINGGAAGTSGTGGYGAGKKPGLFFHDAWNEYAVALPEKDKKFSMSLGAGLHYYMGLSRLTMASTLNFLTIDAPIFNWPLIENSDQFARQVGLFAKGKYGKLEYRLSYNKPYATNLVPTNVTNATNAVAVDNSGMTKWSKAGYFEYQFLDQEANLLPYKVGSYLGTKKVFNVGAGFYTAPDATKTSVNSAITKHDIKLFSADIFLDLPVGKKENKMAVTGYSVLYDYDFGPNYLRNVGIMNIGSVDPNFTGNRAIAGAGNAQPTIGSGNIWYTQAGVLLPNNEAKPKIRIQPFGAVTYKNFDALEQSSTQFDVGSNFFLDGHHAKITAQYSTRPVYTSLTNRSGSLGDFVVQLQIYL
ncbi:short chain amide porin [Flavobacterium fryxellicola]|uniref:Porin n=1 Tax=Flavobacterium fryxellicola TaxID=249352 RepID=A0A167U1S0_9FLAO|nr:porin [Flavobacterium fryxellicola]OAB25170.1 porin [Flavobacterium fryxellicola]SHN50113.1 short chain amide porin [Flavobacterium fryxellicola]